MKKFTIQYVQELIKAQEEFCEPLVGWARNEQEAYVKGLKDMWGLVTTEAYTSPIRDFDWLLEHAEDK